MRLVASTCEKPLCRARARSENPAGAAGERAVHLEEHGSHDQRHHERGAGAYGQQRHVAQVRAHEALSAQAWA